MDCFPPHVFAHAAVDVHPFTQSLLYVSLSRKTSTALHISSFNFPASAPIFCIFAAEKFHNLIVVLRLMGKYTVCAVFYPPGAGSCRLDITRRTRTVLIRMHRAIAKQAIKCIGICLLMTRKIFTCTVTKISGTIFHILPHFFLYFILQL